LGPWKTGIILMYQYLGTSSVYSTLGIILDV
jgi:hypothetical protein